MHRLMQVEKSTLRYAIALLLVCFGLLLTARAVVPPPDGGHSNDNTASTPSTKLQPIKPPQAPGINGQPSPQGIYAVTNYSNNPLADGSDALPRGFADDPTFLSSSIAGLAIYVPLATLLPDPLPEQYAGFSWEQLFDSANPKFHDWNWSYLDKMIATALEHKKAFSVAVVVGFQSAGSATLPPQEARGYLKTLGATRVPSFEPSLPSWFESRCNPRNAASYYPLPLAPGGSPSPGSTTSPWSSTSCAPTFNVLYLPTRLCLSNKIPLPWNANVQKFWGALAMTLAAHLKGSCYDPGNRLVGPCREGRCSVYEALTLVHLPGLSVFDEELSFPNPKRPLPTTSGSCPDGRSFTPKPTSGNDWATNSVAYDCSQANLVRLGYTESPPSRDRPATTNLIEGFKVIAGSFARAFPDRVLGLSPLNNVAGVDLPNLNRYFPTGGVFRKIAFDVAALIRATGSSFPLELQSDDQANIFWDPQGKNARRFPWVNPQHFFSGLNAVYGWQTNVGGVVQFPNPRIGSIAAGDPPTMGWGDPLYQLHVDPVYQLHDDGRILRFTGTDCDAQYCPGWELLDNNTRNVEIAAAGSQIYQRHNDSSIWRYTGAPCNGTSCPGWERLDNNTATASVAAGGSQLYQLHKDGSIWRYLGHPCSGESCVGWEKLDNNPRTIVIAASRTTLFQQRNDGAIWRYTGTPCSSTSCLGWQLLDNNPATKAIATAANQLFQLHKDGSIWCSTGVPCNGTSCLGWEELDNNPKTIAIAGGGNQLYQLHKDGGIWRYTGTPCGPTSCLGWEELDNNPNTRDIVATGGHLYQRQADGRIWRYTGQPCSSSGCPGWQQLDNNPRTTQIAEGGFN